MILKRSIYTLCDLSKFSLKDYVEFLHPSTFEALNQYRQQRNCNVAVTEETPFFISTRVQRLGCYLRLRQVHLVFIGLRDDFGWRIRDH